jgi:hypothetical protein
VVDGNDAGRFNVVFGTRVSWACEIPAQKIHASDAENHFI